MKLAGAITAIALGTCLAVLGLRVVRAQLNRMLLLRHIDKVEWNRFIQNLLS